jgi:hypothetical protein
MSPLIGKLVISALPCRATSSQHRRIGIEDICRSGETIRKIASVVAALAVLSGNDSRTVVRPQSVQLSHRLKDMSRQK